MAPPKPMVTNPLAALRAAIAPVRKAVNMRGEAEDIAGRLPPLMIEADRVAATVAPGIHGRRRIGQGESFWEFRPFRDEDPSQAIDWRQSAKTQNLFVREREWEAAASVWLWRDASASMDYMSDWGTCTKFERATVLSLALASRLIRGGERVAILGDDGAPAHGKTGLARLARTLMRAPSNGEASLPPKRRLPRHAQVVMVGDWLRATDEVESAIAHFASLGVRGHLIQVLDPAEEDLPFDGRTEFRDVEGPDRLIAGRAEHLRSAYKARLAELQHGLAQMSRKRLWTFAVHRTDRAPNAAVLALYTAMTAHKPMGGGRVRL